MLIQVACFLGLQSNRFRERTAREMTAELDPPNFVGMSREVAIPSPMTSPTTRLCACFV
jgi:hypothetical protein